MVRSRGDWPFPPYFGSEFNILFPSMSSTDLVLVWIDRTAYPNGAASALPLVRHPCRDGLPEGMSVSRRQVRRYFVL